MDVKEVSAETAISPERLEDFERQCHVVWDQLTYLRTTVFLLREVLSFPIWALSWDKQIFLRVVTRSFYESAVLAITRIITDKSEGVLTLLVFRNKVVDMLLPEAVDSFKRRLKETKFDAAARELADRARELRNNRLAHLSISEMPPNVTLDELEQLVASVERLYEPLLFRAVAWFLPIEYVPEVRAANTPASVDIEEVLEGFARRSYTINMPERNPLAWPHHRQSMQPEKLEAVNLWRRRIGLPEA